MDYKKKILVPETVFTQEVEGEIVLLDMSGEHYFGLDAVGSDIWKLLQEGKTLEETYAALLDGYDVAPDVLRADLDRFIDDLLKSGLVSVAP